MSDFDGLQIEDWTASFGSSVCGKVIFTFKMLECLEGAVPTVDTFVLFPEVYSLDCIEPLPPPPCELVDSPAAKIDKVLVLHGGHLSAKIGNFLGIQGRLVVLLSVLGDLWLGGA